MLAGVDEVVLLNGVVATFLAVKATLARHA